MIYCRKSFYKRADTFRVGKLTFFFLQILTLFIMLYNYNYGFVVLNTVTLFYFALYMFSIKRNVSKYHAEITRYYKGSVKIYKICFCIYLIFTVILILNVLFTAAFVSILWWVGAVSIMGYSEVVMMSPVIAFGNDGYISGDYYIKYDEIEEIREEKRVNAWRGELVWLTYFEKNQKIGFDKMFLDEYSTLRLKIRQL